MTASRDFQWSEVVIQPPEDHFSMTELRRSLADAARRLQPGARVAVAVGSRGIARLAEVVGEVVATLGEAGARPVLVPAMGSHGGATSAGQADVLRGLGICAEEVGAELDASMDVRLVGRLRSGLPVFLSSAALDCDAVVPVNRVKPHTDFRGDVESGLTKMLTIGLGKEVGASALHRAGFRAFGTVLPEAAALVLGALQVPFGVALVEDTWHRLAHAEVVPGHAIVEGDHRLLQEAWEHFGRLPFDELDVLLVKEMGKTVSGSGMDPNVTGRFPDLLLPAATRVGNLAVLDLRTDAGGNAIGVGAADVVTERLRDKVDWAYTYANARASKVLSGARLPLAAASDEEAFELCLGSVVGQWADGPRAVAMSNTLEVTHLAVSANLVEPAVEAGYQVVGEDLRADFSSAGELRAIGGLRFFGTIDSLGRDAPGGRS